MKKPQTVEEAISKLLSGGVGVMPTDTVYGLVARAADPVAVAKLYALKHREHKPGTVIAANVGQLRELGLDADDLRRAAPWWPNPLSVVIGAAEKLAYLHQGLASLVVRIPKDEGLRVLLERTGVMITSSANAPGEPGAVTIEQAWDYFGETADFYVDGGELAGRAPSTIVRLRENGMEILREGAMSSAELGLDR